MKMPAYYLFTATNSYLCRSKSQFNLIYFLFLTHFTTLNHNAINQPHHLIFKSLTRWAIWQTRGSYQDISVWKDREFMTVPTSVTILMYKIIHIIPYVSVLNCMNVTKHRNIFIQNDVFILWCNVRVFVCMRKKWKY